MNKKFLVVLLSLLVFITACGFSTPQEGQRAIILNKGKFKEVQTPGRQWLGLYEDSIIINVSTVNVDFYDSSVLAGGSKPVAVDLAISVRRTTNEALLQTSFSNYRAIMTNKDALEKEVQVRTADAMKQAIAKIGFYAIIDSNLGEDDNLGPVECATDGAVGREAFKECISSYLREPLLEVGLELVAVQVKDVIPSDELLGLISELSTVKEQSDLAEARLALIDQQILEAQKLTELAQEQSKAYAESPELLQLRMKELDIQEAQVWADAEGITVILFNGGSDIQPIIPLENLGE